MSRTGILIVEDECLVARDIQRMLDALGSAVAGVVSTEEDADRAATEKIPNMILMDIELKAQEGEVREEER